MPELKLSDSVARKLADIAKSIGGGTVQVGFAEDAKYPDGTPVAAVAYWDEMGHGGRFPSPPRSFFRTMIAKESPSWPGKMGYLAKVTNYDGSKVLAAMGEDIQGALIDSINNTEVAPLSPTTLMLRKKFGNSPDKITMHDVLDAQKAVAAGEEGATGTQAKPLIWTGWMLNNTSYKVIK